MLATFTVTNVNDLFVDSAGDAPGTLRQAIFDANALAGTDTIEFDPSLTSGGPATITLFHGELKITSSLTITGPGADLLTIDAVGSDPNPEEFSDGTRVFDVNNNNGTLVNVTMSGLTLTGADSFADGGAIRSLENLTLIETVITGNQSGRGGGLYNGSGTMEIIRSTISDNNNDGPQFGHRGSGITNWTGTLIVTDSTINDNGFTVCEICGGLRGAAGIYNHRGSVEVTESAITGNSGGGIYSDGLDAAADITITDSTISDNVDGWFRGNGLQLSNTVTNIQNSFINDNEGQGIYSRFGNLTIEGCTISGNTGFQGAGVRNVAADLTISATTISGNTATGDGGGVYHGEGNLSITSSTISGNTAGNEGGGLRLQTSPYMAETMRISNSTISGNTAAWRGGGLWVRTFSGDSLDLVHSTVTGNTADAAAVFSGDGGGLFFFYSTGVDSIDHTIVAGNIAAGERDDIDGNIQASFSLIGDNTNATITDNGGNLIGSGGSPIDPLLAPLADNGGPTMTHRLQIDSPAIDAGDEDAVANMGDVPEFDQRGNPFSRVFDGNGDSIDRIDIGAVESEIIVFVVDTLADESDGDFSSEDLSLREALEQAALISASSPIISFDATLFSGGPQSIFLDFALGQLEMIGNMAIQGPGADLLTVVAAPFRRVISVDDLDNLSQSEAAIRGLTLTGGNDPNGGGAIFTRERLEVADCVITGNTAQWGAGIYNDPYGELTVVNSVISGNDATSSGGGIYNWGGTAFIFDSVISGNDSATDGGGIKNVNNGSMTISRSTLSGNVAQSSGGGLVNGDGNVTIAESTLSGNTADYGGGIYVVTPTDDTTTISNSTISSNIAPLGGAGVFTLSGRTVIQFSTISENDSNDFAGSGVVTWGDSAYALTEIRSTIVAGNHHTDVAIAGGVVDTFDSLGFNLVGTGSVGAFGDPGDSVIGTDDPGLGPLADNGGPTFTHALLADSPAIDMGDPDFVAPPDFDQRGVGFDRVRDGDDTIGEQIDIGAFELQQPPGPELPGDYNLDESVDAADYVLWRKTLGATPVPRYSGADGDGDMEIDPGDYDVWHENYGESLPGGGGGAESRVESRESRAGVLVQVTSLISDETAVGAQRAMPVLATANARSERTAYLGADWLGSSGERRQTTAVAAETRQDVVAWRQRAIAAWLTSLSVEIGAAPSEADFGENEFITDERETNDPLSESLDAVDLAFSELAAHA